MIETRKLGEQAARAMEYLDNNEDMDGGRIVACMIVVIVADEDNSTSYTRTFSSDSMYYQQMGLVEAAKGCVQDGFRFFNPAEADEDDDDE